MRETSLRRLNTDRIDLYYLHVWDFTTPWEEILLGLENLTAGIRTGPIVSGISEEHRAQAQPRCS